MGQALVVSLRAPNACRDGSECSERVVRCQLSPITRADGSYAEFLFTLL